MAMCVANPVREPVYVYARVEIGKTICINRNVMNINTTRLALPACTPCMCYKYMAVYGAHIRLLSCIMLMPMLELELACLA